MFAIWLEAAEWTLLGFDAQRVIALRAMKIVAGGSSARSEVQPYDDGEVPCSRRSSSDFDERRLPPKSYSSLPDAGKGKCETAIEIGGRELT